MYFLAAVAISLRSTHSLKISSPVIKEEKVGNFGRHRGTYEVAAKFVRYITLDPIPILLNISRVEAPVLWSQTPVRRYVRGSNPQRISKYALTWIGEAEVLSLRGTLFVDCSLPGLVGILKSNVDSRLARSIRFHFMILKRVNRISGLSKRQGKRAVGRTSNYHWFSTFYFFEFMIITDNRTIV